MDALGDHAATQALGANLDCLVGAVFRGNTDILEIRTKFPTGNAGDLRTNTLEALRTTTRGHLVANLTAFSTNFTNPRHDYFLDGVEMRASHKLRLPNDLVCNVPKTFWLIIGLIWEGTRGEEFRMV